MGGGGGGGSILPQYAKHIDGSVQDCSNSSALAVLH